MQQPDTVGRPGTAERLDSVQLLRAIAAVSVVAFHTPFFRPIGSWGVTLFFVISGFIVCYVTETTSVHFLQKRILRIVPLYWAGTLVVFGITLVVPSLVQSTTADFGDLLKSLFFIPFYKGQTIAPVLFLGWTLNLEMFFYLLFAISLTLTQRYRALICSLIIFGLAVAGQLLRTNIVIWQFFTQPIILDFILGMACFALLKRAGIGRSSRPSFIRRLVFTTLGSIFLISMPLSIGQAPEATGLTPGATGGVVLAVLGAFALFCLVYGLSGTALPRPIVMVGDASYSLYLFHPYVIQLFARVFKSFEANDTGARVLAVLAISLCCLLAVMLYRFVEAPVTRYLRRTLLAKGPRGDMAGPPTRRGAFAR